jgi:pimeloyl-ACP methyl ester carboxylesterase
MIRPGNRGNDHMLASKRFADEAIDLHYVQGPDNGAPLVLLHGLSDRWQTFLPLIPFLYPYHTLYAPDLRGHGLSARAGEYKIIDYARDIESFLRHTFSEPVSLGGHSLGAAISLFIAARHPRLCKCLVLIDPFVFEDKLEDTGFCKYFDSCYTAIDRNKDAAGIYSTIKETGALAKKRASDLFQLDKRSIMEVLAKTVFTGFDLDELLAGIKCPVLVLRGNPDMEAYLSEQKAAYLQSRITDCVLEYLPDASHVVHVDQPLATAKHMLNFLTSVYDAL